MAVNGLALGAAGVGVVLLWSGLHNQKITTAIQDIVQGKKPAAGPFPTIGSSSYYGTGVGPIGGGSAAGSTTGSAIANDAIQYQGHCYLYGGAPGANGRGCWDCSSFVNWVLGHDLGLDIPGSEGYSGVNHGPNTLAYLVWGGVTSIPRASVAAGDLLVWQTHMGIAINNAQMISAQDPIAATGISGIDATTKSLGEFLFCKRVKAA
jgi:cell wall-associated NlpC family hydrolase